MPKTVDPQRKRKLRIKARRAGVTGNIRSMTEEELEEAIEGARSSRNGSSKSRSEKSMAVKTKVKKSRVVDEDEDFDEDEDDEEVKPKKRGPGRPKGSKTKTVKVKKSRVVEEDDDDEDFDEDEDEDEVKPKKRGRPKGSTNKTTVKKSRRVVEEDDDDEDLDEDDEDEDEAPRKRGRPKGSTSKTRSVGRPKGTSTGTRVPIKERLKWNKKVNFRDGSQQAYILNQLRKSAEKYDSTSDIRDHTIRVLTKRLGKDPELQFKNRETGKFHKGEKAESMLKLRVNHVIFIYAKETGQHESAEANGGAKRAPKSDSSKVKRGRVSSRAADDDDDDDDFEEDEDEAPKKKRGRPKGSTNKKRKSLR